MAGLGDLTIKTSEYRTCLVNGEKALFHRWSQNADIEYSQTFAIVELTDGNVREVKPESIKFIDGKIGEYCFSEPKGPLVWPEGVEE